MKLLVKQDTLVSCLKCDMWNIVLYNTKSSLYLRLIVMSKST